MHWQSVKNKNTSSTPVVKVLFTSLFLLIVLLLPLETNGTACGSPCESTDECSEHYLTPTGVCCYDLDSCALLQQCMYNHTASKPTYPDYCDGNTWKYNATVSCTDTGWKANYETESCISCGCCDGDCVDGYGCDLNPNNANCPSDGWVNSGSSYSCCSTDNSQACTCQNQQYLNYYCDGSDQGHCACKYTITDSRTVFSGCSTCPAAGEWSTCSSCSYSTTCSTSGTGTQSRATHTCSSGSCTTGSESRSCTCTRVTDGTSCGTPGEWSACSSCSWSSDCDNSAPGTQSRTTYICSGGSCITGSETQSCTCTRNTDGDLCGSSSCPSDICTGTCPGCVWRDYPSSCDRYCLSSSCQSCSCDYLDRNPDSGSEYCTGCGNNWDSTASKCCGDDGGTTDTWCNTGSSACVSGAWYANHCSDGIKDCDEEGTDFGGACGCNLNRTGNTTINFSCVLEGEHHLVAGNLTIATGGSLQMNANSKLIFDLGHEIKIEGTGSVLKSASNTIIQQQ